MSRFRARRAFMIAMQNPSELDTREGTTTRTLPLLLALMVVVACGGAEGPVLRGSDAAMEHGFGGNGGSSVGGAGGTVVGAGGAGGSVARDAAAGGTGGSTSPDAFVGSDGRRTDGGAGSDAAGGSLGGDSGADASVLMDCTGLICGADQQGVSVLIPALGLKQCACVPIPSEGRCTDCGPCGAAICAQYFAQCLGFSLETGLGCTQNG